MGDLIKDTIDIRREYDIRKEKYEKFIDLVSLILNSSIEKEKIKVHSFKSRVKDYSSFLEKVDRKRYEDSFTQCTDLAGVRIVCLFLNQVDQIKKIIENEFEVIEITNKRTSKKFDQFGYLSLHMIIKMPKHRKQFVEYQDLEGLVCEVQIRTILQEAWAEIEHYLNYKATKEEKNQELLRKIFSLAGMLEVADSTFEDISTGFSKMVHKKVKISEGSITALNLYKFSRAYFKEFDDEWDKRQERKFFKLSMEIKKLSIIKMMQLKDLLEKNKLEIDKYCNIFPNKKIFAVELIRVALALEFGHKFDLIFGLRGFSDKIKRILNIRNF